MPEALNFTIGPDGLPMLRTSGRKDLRRCQWLWYEHWVRGWTPRRPPTWSIFGLSYHEAMAVLYPPGPVKLVRRLEKAQEKFVEALDGEIRKVGVDVFEEEYEREERKAEESGKSFKLIPADELGPIMLENYVVWAKREHGGDEEWEVLHTEQPFQINVPYPRSWGPRFKDQIMAVYCGTWDSFMRNIRTGAYWLWDWKTCKQFPNPGLLEMDDQAGSYLWVAKEVLVHKGILQHTDKIEGINFQYFKKALPDARPANSSGEALNKDGSVSLRQPTSRFLRVPSHRSIEQNVRQARRVQKEMVHMEQLLEDPEMIYKNMTHECSRCILYDPCQLHEAGDDWELMLDQLYEQRDPFADHREAMEKKGVEL